MSVLVALQSAGNTSTATWDQAPATWAATAAESFPSTATFTQAAATWQATASEAYPSSATWLQAAATWAAVASEAFAATGSFVQAAAAWSAIATETFATTATWNQAAATWDALANQTSDRSSTATWDQAAATWDAVATGPAATGGMGGRYGPIRIVRREQVVPEVIPEAVVLAAAWSQAPASWKADVDVGEDEPLWLLFDEPVLIGAR